MHIVLHKVFPGILQVLISNGMVGGFWCWKRGSQTAMFDHMFFPVLFHTVCKAPNGKLMEKGAAMALQCSACDPPSKFLAACDLSS